MKRLALTLAFGLAAFSAFAQAPFTIVRPKDGAKVKELVRLLVPKNSVPNGGYIGIFIGGKFVEATIPPLDKTGKYYEYDLDTKAKGIADGKLTLEAVLYVDYQEKPRIVDRTSVEVTVANTADSKIPDKGLLLRYKWTPGTETVYDFSAREIFDVSDSKKNKIGGKPIETVENLEKFRILYAVDNAYSDGSGLVRMQALPDKGKDSAFVHTVQTPEGVRMYSDQMHPIYMKLSSTGLAEWGSFPFATRIEGNSAEQDDVNLLVADPPPTLPFNPVKIGGAPWASRFQDGAIPPDEERYLANNFVSRSQARGEFKGVEWEMGHPCAKLVNSLEVGQKSAESKALEMAGRTFTGNKQSEVETIWFALDKRQIIKIVRSISFTQEVATANRGFGGGGSGSAGPGPAPGPMGPGAGPRGDREDLPPPTFPDLQTPKTAGLGNQGRKIAANGNGGNGGPNRGTGTSSGAPASTTFIRITFEETYVLEQ